MYGSLCFVWKHAIIFATLKSCLRAFSALFAMWLCSVRAAVKYALIPDSMQCLRHFIHRGCTLPNTHCCAKGDVLVCGLESWMIWDYIVSNIIMIITRWTRTSFTTRACVAQQTIESSMDNRWEGKFINSVFHYTAQLWRIKLVKLSVILDQYNNEQEHFPPIISIDNILNISGQWEPVSLDVLHSEKRQHGEWL